MEDLHRSSGSSTSVTEVNIAIVKKVMTKNPHSNLRDIAAELSLSYESIRTIFNNQLDMKHVADWLVRDDLNFLQKLNHISVAEDTLQQVNCVVAGAETCIYEFKMQTSQQTSERGLPTEPKSKKPR